MGNGKSGFLPTEGWKDFAKFPASPNQGMVQCYSIISKLKFMSVQQGRYLIKPKEVATFMTYEAHVKTLLKELKSLALGFNDDVTTQGKEK